jgi:hypothetical protein
MRNSSTVRGIRHIDGCTPFSRHKCNFLNDLSVRQNIADGRVQNSFLAFSRLPDDNSVQITLQQLLGIINKRVAVV